jgi:predicted kinase
MTSPPIPTLVIVSGLPASGKTTLARWLAAELRLPLYARDDIKEQLFDSLGWSDRAWSQRLGRASWALLYWALESQLSAGRSCIAESNFDPQRDTSRLNGLHDRYGFRAIQIHCHADGHVLVERYMARVADGTRHPGHVDDFTIDEYRDRLLATTPQPLALGNRVVTIDTTDPSAIDYDWMASEVRSMMAEDE